MLKVFILEKRKNSVKNLVDNFFGGMSIKLENSTTISNIHTYYSSLEYLSSENIINELTNLLLAFYNSNNNLTKTITTNAIYVII